MPKVLKRQGFRTPIPPGAVYVGRPSRWGNPFKPRDGSMAERMRVIALHRRLVEERLKLDPDWLEPLRGHDLVCYCFPLPCHADALVELANRETSEICTTRGLADE